MKKFAWTLPILIAFAISGGYFIYFFDGFAGLSDGNDYAGLARSLIRGEGFSLGHLYPLALTFRGGIPQPDNIWPPAYPVYLAIWFLLFGARDSAILGASVAIIWIYILATYLLARRFLDRSGAILAAALVGMNQSALGTALEGSPEMLTGTLLVLSMVAITGKISNLKMAAAGLLFGLAILSRYQIAVLAPAIIVFFLSGSARRIILWTVFAAAAVAPWLIRNWLLLGDPLFTLQTYGEFTKGMGHLKYYYYTYRSFTPMTIGYALWHFPFYLFKKFAAGIVIFTLNTPVVMNLFGVVPLLYALKASIGRKETCERYIVFAAVSLALIVVFSSLDGHHWRHIVNLQGVLCVAIVLGMKRMFGQFRIFKSKYLSVAAIILLFLPVRAPWQERELLRAAESVRAAKPVYQRIAELTREDDVIVSDASDAMWWYADRNSIWIPVVYEDLLRLTEIQRVDYIHLEDTSGFLSELSDGDKADFAARVDFVDGVQGGWSLYRLRHAEAPGVPSVIPEGQR